MFRVLRFSGEEGALLTMLSGSLLCISRGGSVPFCSGGGELGRADGRESTYVHYVLFSAYPSSGIYIYILLLSDRRGGGGGGADECLAVAYH